MKIAIIGGAGFIGTYLTKTYLDAGHDVLIIDSLIHRPYRALDPRARFYHVDIRSPQLRTILQLERPDIVSHHATQQHMLPIEQTLTDADVHIRGLLNVLDSCVDASVQRFIFASGGCSLYGHVHHEKLPLPENVPLNPQSAHDIHKATGEWYVRYYTQQYGLNHTILRYARVYGAGYATCPPHPIHYFAAMLLEQRCPVIREKGQSLRDHIFIDDVTRANLCLLKRGGNCTLHISSGQGVSLNQIYQMVAQELHSHLKPIYFTRTQLPEHDIVLDNALAQRVLSWQPKTSLHEGIQLTIAHMRESLALTICPQPSHLFQLKTAEVVSPVETTLSRV